MKRKSLNHVFTRYSLSVLLLLQLLFLFASMEGEILYLVQLLLGTISVNVVLLFYRFSRFVRKRRFLAGFHLE
jgi:hypothetical protein